MLKVFSVAADAKLPGWSIDEMKYWKSVGGKEYLEVTIRVGEEALWIRLRSTEEGYRLGGVKFYTKRELSRRKDSTNGETDVRSGGVE